MPRPRSPDRDQAYKIWKESGGTKKLKDIAAELNVSEAQIRKWKNQDKWNKVTLPNTNSNVTKRKKVKKEAAADTVESVLENSDLTDKQQLFCIYLAYGDSATAAYQKAYGCSYQAAMANASRLLRNDKVRAEAERLKKERFEAKLFDEHDIFQWYLDVAQASITDFVTFGREEVQAMGAFGPIVDKKSGEPIMKEINYVKFRESADVNGHIIKKVKLGKDGASIELYDAMEAMDWLAEHMGMGTEEQQSLAAGILGAYEKGKDRRKKESEQDGEVG